MSQSEGAVEDEEPNREVPSAVAAGDESFADPLLGCLELLCRHYDRAIPAQALISGLPLEDGRLTPQLFVRAAARAGLSSKVIRRPLTRLTSLLMPAVVLLADGGAVLLLSRDNKGKARVLLPESGRGAGVVDIGKLDALASGYLIVAKPEYRFGQTATAEVRPNGAHWFWDTVSPLWPTYMQVLAAAALVNILGLAAPLFIMNVYDRVMPNKAFSTLWVLAVGMGLAILFDFVFRTLRAALIGNAGRRADVLLAGRLFEHVLGMDMSRRPVKTGEFANHLKDYEIVREFFTSNTLVTFTDFLFIWLFIYIIYMIAGVAALVPLIAVFIVIIVGLLLQIPMRRVVRDAQSEAAHRHSMLIEAISGIETIKCSRAESQMQRQWEQFVGKNSRTAEQLRFWSTLGLNLTTMTQQLVTVGVVVVGIYLFDAGTVSPGAIIAAVILAGRVGAPLGQIASTIARSQQAFQSLGILNEIMAAPVEAGEGARHMDKTIEKGAIVFKDVVFTYPGSERPALNGLSLAINPGERVGIIGRIGSGKTTIGRLLCRLYVPTEGSLLLDGVDIGQYHPSEVRRRIAYVAQDATLFDGSVRDNIVLGAPYISDDHVVRAAELSGAADFVRQHPMGYSMPVGEDGRLLSSGQKQAVALARAFLLDPLVIFLDEPSSAMDMATERALLGKLKSAVRSDQTLIITTHRNSMLALVDRLVVIEEGRVAADGPREQVLQALTQPAPKRSTGHPVAMSTPGTGAGGNG